MQTTIDSGGIAHGPGGRLARLLAVILLVAGVACEAAEEHLPDGVEQIIPRGQIAAVVEPEFVPPREAHISDDAWVLGVVVDGHARAYSLNLLNSHEVVNDTIGNTSFAVVW